MLGERKRKRGRRSHDFSARVPSSRRCGREDDDDSDGALSPLATAGEKTKTPKNGTFSLAKEEKVRLGRDFASVSGLVPGEIKKWERKTKDRSSTPPLAKLTTAESNQQRVLKERRFMESLRVLGDTKNSQETSVKKRWARLYYDALPARDRANTTFAQIIVYSERSRQAPRSHAQFLPKEGVSFSVLRLLSTKLPL